MDIIKIIEIISQILVGITAIVSLWISRKALEKSDWNSAMSTSPALILRLKETWVGARKKEENGYSVVEKGEVIKKEPNFTEIVFTLVFECFNAGRGVAFNIFQPKFSGASLINQEFNKIPLFQTLNDEPFRIELQMSKSFEKWVEDINNKIPVELQLTYTNDQNNVFCRSKWFALVKPFEKEGENLKVKKELLKMKSKIEYSSKPLK